MPLYQNDIDETIGKSYYIEFDFCKEMKCPFYDGNYIVKNRCTLTNITNCRYTAKKFFDWLRERDGVIFINEEKGVKK